MPVSHWPSSCAIPAEAEQQYVHKSFSYTNPEDPAPNTKVSSLRFKQFWAIFCEPLPTAPAATLLLPGASVA
ncbi:hypothetical protein ACP4OV_015136 [Aristida adscensionis]